MHHKNRRANIQHCSRTMLEALILLWFQGQLLPARAIVRESRGRMACSAPSLAGGAKAEAGTVMSAHTGAWSEPSSWASIPEAVQAAIRGPPCSHRSVQGDRLVEFQRAQAKAFNVLTPSFHVTSKITCISGQSADPLHSLWLCWRAPADF